jgi:hypothetical protein
MQKEIITYLGHALKTVALALAGWAICYGAEMSPSITATLYLTDGKTLYNIEVKRMNEAEGLIVYSPDFKGSSQYKLDQIAKIVFSGGDENAKGIVLANGITLNGKVEFIKMKVDAASQNEEYRWKIVVDGLPGSVLTLHDGLIRSINFREPALDSSGAAAGDNAIWKYKGAKAVLEWIYENSSENALGANSKYNLAIDKITLAGNQVVLHTKVYGDFEKGKYPCYVSCTLEDDIGNTYDTNDTEIGPIRKTRDSAKQLQIRCPSVASDATKVVIKIRNHDNWGGSRCGPEKWRLLPELNIDAFK